MFSERDGNAYVAIWIMLVVSVIYVMDVCH